MRFGFLKMIDFSKIFTTKKLLIYSLYRPPALSVDLGSSNLNKYLKAPNL